ncbi:hypothetical protein J5N97_018839 [Dioscorea zingiberensis]|uniref:SKP1-like protein n=1 Tax=Dioscorea zingiberensis TaxID=325984 RepID=A0A9D5CDM5_9LILI|nr:hypothetical protein J5N97_018839 [Dioscorea zingiberensis]
MIINCERDSIALVIPTALPLCPPPLPGFHLRMTDKAEPLKFKEGVPGDDVPAAVSETPAQKKILLKTIDGEEFLVDELVVRESGMIKNMIDDGCAEGGIPLPNLTAPVLAKVLEYWKNHVGKSPKETEAFDKEFVRGASRDLLLEVIMAANYLDCKPLLDLTCQTVADAISNMTVEQLREYFGIENDFTPEEEAAIREENSWAFE